MHLNSLRYLVSITTFLILIKQTSTAIKAKGENVLCGAPKPSREKSEPLVSIEHQFAC